MDENRVDSVSYLVYESSQTRSDRLIHRLIIAMLISVLLLFISNALWLWAWIQRPFPSEGIAVSQDGEGVNIIGSQNGVGYEPSEENQGD